MTYQEQLDTFDWKRKRASIIRYNLYKCYFCGSTTQLQVHHKYYIKGVKAWEYPDDALVTLCESCHQKIHKLQTPLYYGDSQKKRYFQLTPCSRCGGSGYIPKYKNIEGGVCFSCQGARFREFYNIQMSDESSIEMLNHISISIKELAELTNNPELSYEFEDNLIKIVVYENKKEMGFYYLSPGDNLSKNKVELTYKFFEENIHHLRVVETQPDEGFLYVSTGLTEDMATLECDRFRRCKYKGFHQRSKYSIRTAEGDIIEVV